MRTCAYSCIIFGARGTHATVLHCLSWADLSSEFAQCLSWIIFRVKSQSIVVFLCRVLTRLPVACPLRRQLPVPVWHVHILGDSACKHWKIRRYSWPYGCPFRPPVDIKCQNLPWESFNKPFKEHMKSKFTMWYSSQVVTHLQGGGSVDNNIIKVNLNMSQIN